MREENCLLTSVFMRGAETRAEVRTKDLSAEVVGRSLGEGIVRPPVGLANGSILPVLVPACQAIHQVRLEVWAASTRSY